MQASTNILAGVPIGLSERPTKNGDRSMHFAKFLQADGYGNISSNLLDVLLPETLAQSVRPNEMAVLPVRFSGERVYCTAVPSLMNTEEYRTICEAIDRTRNA